MVCRLMPAARATSASVIADQSRLPSSSRIASSTESRRRARDASAYGTLRICATLTPLAPLLFIAALYIVAGGSGSRAGDCHHLEVRLRGAAVRAAPVLGDVVPAGAGRDAVLRPPLGLVVFEATLHADEQFVVAHFVASRISKSGFSRTAQPGQRKATIRPRLRNGPASLRAGAVAH